MFLRRWKLFDEDFIFGKENERAMERERAAAVARTKRMTTCCAPRSPKDCALSRDSPVLDRPAWQENHRTTGARPGNARLSSRHYLFPHHVCLSYYLVEHGRLGLTGPQKVETILRFVISIYMTYVISSAAHYGLHSEPQTGQSTCRATLNITFKAGTSFSAYVDPL